MRLAQATLETLFGDRLTWRERMGGGPAWAQSELVSTKSARQHLVDWLETAGPSPWEPLEIDDIIAPLRATFHGDIFVHNVLFAVLAKIPRPVAEYALANVTWLGLGCALLGTCGPVTDFGDRVWRVDISAPRAVNGKFPPTAGVEYLIAHEIGHCWTMPAPDPGMYVWTRAEVAFIYNEPLAEIERRRPAAALVAKTLRQRYAKYERVADRLARQWGFPDVDGVGKSTAPSGRGTLTGA